MVVWFVIEELRGLNFDFRLIALFFYQFVDVERGGLGRISVYKFTGVVVKAITAA